MDIDSINSRLERTLTTLLIAMATVLGSCQKEEALAGSHAIDEGDQIMFQEGDQVGLYSVEDNTLEAINICMTAKIVGGKLVWGAPKDVELFTADRYFIYYPYKETLPSAVDATRTTAADFFAGVVTSWVSTADQSTQALYTASDLMIGCGVAGSEGSDGILSVSVALTHTMGWRSFRYRASHTNLKMQLLPFPTTRSRRRSSPTSRPLPLAMMPIAIW